MRRAHLATWALLTAIVGAAGEAAAQSCESYSGGFAWSCSRAIPGLACTQISEPADNHTWGDNYFCASRDLGIRWSYAGPVAGMRCTAVAEPADPDTWTDNYLCVPGDSPVVFSWSYWGPIPGLQCVQWNEPADPHTWNDNYLCWSGLASLAMPPIAPPPVVATAPAPVESSCESMAGGFAWSCSRPLPGMECTQIVEPADGHTWNDNYFCAPRGTGARWSNAGPVPGMRCTQIVEPADPDTWNDNFLCLPPRSPYAFQWSYAGRLPRQQCVQWNEPADPHTWNDNFLCVTPARRGLPPPGLMIGITPPGR